MEEKAINQMDENASDNSTFVKLKNTVAAICLIAAGLILNVSIFMQFLSPSFVAANQLQLLRLQTAHHFWATESTSDGHLAVHVFLKPKQSSQRLYCTDFKDCDGWYGHLFYQGLNNSQLRNLRETLQQDNAAIIKGDQATGDFQVLKFESINNFGDSMSSTGFFGIHPADRLFSMVIPIMAFILFVVFFLAHKRHRLTFGLLAIIAVPIISMAQWSVAHNDEISIYLKFKELSIPSESAS